MPKKKYIVTLTDQEGYSLEDLTKKGKSPAYKVNQARILLLADTNRSGGGWSEGDISQTLIFSVATIERVRQRLVEQGLSTAKKSKAAPKSKTASPRMENKKPISLPSPVAHIKSG